MSRIRILPLAMTLLLLAGCQVLEERAALRPLPEDVPPMPYAELLTRARQQASVATNSFYVNNWTDLDDAAKGLEQTARFMNRAVDVPDKQKDALRDTATALGKDAAKLRELASAKDRDINQITEQLTTINKRIREMRLEN
jgi:hypothetical protein